MPALVLAQIEPQYIMSRNTFNREASSKMYSSTVFALCQMLAEMPYSVVCLTICVGALLTSSLGLCNCFFPAAVLRCWYAKQIGSRDLFLAPGESYVSVCRQELSPFRSSLPKSTL